MIIIFFIVVLGLNFLLVCFIELGVLILGIELVGFVGKLGDILVRLGNLDFDFVCLFVLFLIFVNFVVLVVCFVFEGVLLVVIVLVGICFFVFVDLFCLFFFVLFFLVFVCFCFFYIIIKLVRLMVRCWFFNGVFCGKLSLFSEFIIWGINWVW